jgi:predicted  nucleic acid-binding Zn-ribbon protein
MPHQCVRCSKLYNEGEIDVLAGCPCGAKMFYYLKPEKYNKMLKEHDKKSSSKEENIQVEEDFYDLMGSDIDRDKPVILDIESIEVTKPGKYKLDLVKLFQEKEPFIIKLEDGKYYVDLIENFKRLTKSSKEARKK